MTTLAMLESRAFVGPPGRPDAACLPGGVFRFVFFMTEVRAWSGMRCIKPDAMIQFLRHPEPTDIYAIIQRTSG